MQAINVLMPYFKRIHYVNTNVNTSLSSAARHILTLCLPVSSADNLGKHFGPRSGPTSRRA